MRREMDLNERATLTLDGDELWTLYASCRLYNRGEPVKIVRSIHQSITGSRSELLNDSEKPELKEVADFLKAAKVVGDQIELTLTRSQLKAAISAVRDVNSDIARKRAGRKRVSYLIAYQQRHAVDAPKRYGISTRGYDLQVAERLLSALKSAIITRPVLRGESRYGTDPGAIVDQRL